MRALFFGRDVLEQRISAIINGLEIDVVKNHKFDNVHGDYDLAIIDMSTENAEAACHSVSDSLEIPLVLIVKDKGIDWQRMDQLNAIGFIRETDSTEEMVARIGAVARRILSPPLRKDKEYFQ
jgi:hypothetical protein